MTKPMNLAHFQQNGAPAKFILWGVEPAFPILTVLQVRLRFGARFLSETALKCKGFV